MRKDAKTWSEIYEEDIRSKGTDLEYIKRKLERKNVLIQMVERHSAPKGKIIECGSGTAVISMHLASLGYDVKAIDNDADVLKLSRRLAESYIRNEGLGIESRPEFEEKSIFELDYPDHSFDVAFSNGVLEHFNDSEIKDTVAQQLRIAKTVIIGIPTKYWETKEAKYGDERVLELDYWRMLIEDAGGDIIEEASMHRKPFLERIFDYEKYFKPAPYRLFAVWSKD